MTNLHPSLVVLHGLSTVDDVAKRIAEAENIPLALCTMEKVEENFKTYKQQAAKILDFSRLRTVYNHEWLEKMSFGDIMKLASHFTIQQMLQRDMFKERMSWKIVCVHCREQFNSPLQFSSTEEMETATLEGNTIRCPHCGKITPITKENLLPPPNPISPNEFLYPLMQGFDSVMLDVDCELGGNDQLFNMLCGRKLQQRYGKREKFVITTPGVATVLNTQFAVNSEKEYLFVGMNPDLKTITASTGGKVFKPNDLDGIVEFVKQSSKKKELKKVFFTWPFLVLAILLLLVEIFIRKKQDNLKEKK